MKMSWFNKSKDFITPTEEVRESVNASVKGLLDGDTLVSKGMRKHLKFILFLVCLAMLYIYNNYRAENLYITKRQLEKDVKMFRFKSATYSSELMKISKQSEVKERIEEAGLELQESKVPPVKLYK
ncbi:MAG: hypothetical protein LBM07_07405 [Culturomica sp.]|jgi:cell division protein FtsL|nr:hypothetical protein [Culturomica sp.]